MDNKNQKFFSSLVFIVFFSIYVFLHTKYRIDIPDRYTGIYSYKARVYCQLAVDRMALLHVAAGAGAACAPIEWSRIHI